jgi:type I restriction enzyme, R subunit
MSKVGQPERATQNRVVKLLKQELNYDYLGDWQDRPNNRNIEESYLAAFLERTGNPAVLVKKALDELQRVVGDQSRNLYSVNKDVYSLLRYGVKVKAEIGEQTQTVWLIDWKNPHNNHFAIAEEVTVRGTNTKRPDIVFYVNGIALGVLELKRSIVFVSEGIRQNLDNQKKEFIQSFFNTMQLVMAGNDTEGLRYGTIETKEKYYLTWKEESTVENLLDRHLLQVCEKSRFLEIIHDFIVFDAGAKKTCRHNQYFGVKAAQEHVLRGEGGIIWHTQGSGKSLTMVWLAKWIRENIPESRVLIVTDRKELDEQIEKVFKGVQEDISRSRSGRDLVAQLNAVNPWLLCSLVHKFTGKEEADIEGFIADVQGSLPKDFVAKGKVFVFVDECHRTQSGVLHDAMKSLLPNAIFIGFTGTPLLKADKRKSIEIFGKYIHTYKYDEAVADKVVLDLVYEARDIDQSISSPEKIDQWFNAKTRGLNDVALAQLKAKWGTMQKVLSSKSRLEKIVADILLDMEQQDRLQSGRGNAILVSGSIYQACKFYELFTSQGFDRCAIVTSYVPSISDLKGQESGEGLTEKLRQYDIYNKMLNGKSSEQFEEDVKKQFINEPAQMKLLIVVDKLLTGFDAPSATYLYIDKQMRDHGLFQAICRVNRLDDEKEYGYIIDYKDLFRSLERSIKDYTSGAFDDFDADDVKDLLKNRLVIGYQRLEEARETIKALCEPVQAPRDTQSYLRYFCAEDISDKEALKQNEAKRQALYKHVAALIRAYANIAAELEAAGYTPVQIETIRQEVDHFEKTRSEVKVASGDYIDLKLYEPAMRHLIDTYIRAEDSQKISAFEDMTLVELIVQKGRNFVDHLPTGIANNPEAVAETVINNLRRVIIDEQPVNPKYYDSMSVLLETLIEERREQALEYERFLARLVEIAGQVVNPSQTQSYPSTMNSKAKRALYDNLGQDQSLVLAIDATIKTSKKDGWRGDKIKERALRAALRPHLPDEALLERILELIRNQSEY